MSELSPRCTRSSPNWTIRKCCRTCFRSDFSRPKFLLTGPKCIELWSENDLKYGIIIKCCQKVGCYCMSVKFKKRCGWVLKEMKRSEGWQEIRWIFWPLGKLNYPMRDRWKPLRGTLPLRPVCWGRVEVVVATINRKNAGAPTVPDGL